MAAGWVKVAADLDSNPKVRRAGRAAREVFLFALRRTGMLDRDGRVPLSGLESWYVADQLMMTEAEAATGLERAITAGLLALVGSDVVICGWSDDWAKRPASGAERTDRWRNKAKDHDAASVGDEKTSRVTPSVTPNVTRDACDGSDQSRSDQSRRDQIRESAADAAQPLTLQAPGHKAKRKRAAITLPVDWIPNATHTAKAQSLGLDLAREAERFRDWHTAKGSTFADWDAAFRTWLSNAIRFGVKPSGGGSALDAVLRIANGEDK